MWWYFWCLVQHLNDESRVAQPTATIWGDLAELYAFFSSTSLCCDRSLRSPAARKIQWKRCRRDVNHEERMEKQVDIVAVGGTVHPLLFTVFCFVQRSWIVAFARKSSSWLLGVFAPALDGALSAFAHSFSGLGIYCESCVFRILMLAAYTHDSVIYHISYIRSQNEASELPLCSLVVFECLHLLNDSRMQEFQDGVVTPPLIMFFMQKDVSSCFINLWLI